METDRSRIIAFQRCPRERYLAYHLNGTGIQRIRKSLPLQFGSAFHVGAEELLSHVGHPSVDINRVEYAVEQALAFLQDEFSAHQISFDGEQPPDVELAMRYGQEEQMALAEALLRAWWAYEGEAFLKTFEILEVEREGWAQLADDLTLMFRPDVLVRDRESGDYFVISWKTRAMHNKRSYDQDRHDMQSISEAWGIGQERGLKIEGVVYKYATKGKRSKDDWDGLYKQDSKLIYAWKKLGQSEEETDWSWKYAWTDPEEVNPKTGRAVGHKLGKGWTKVPVWRDYPGGVKQWVDDLLNQRISPRHENALSEVFPQAMPVERHQSDVGHWLEQVKAQELGIQHSLSILPDDPTEREIALDVLFPQYTHSCHSYSGCSFIDICWGNVKAEPGDLYQIRTQNHPESGGDDE